MSFMTGEGFALYRKLGARMVLALFCLRQLQAVSLYKALPPYLTMVR